MFTSTKHYFKCTQRQDRYRKICIDINRFSLKIESMINIQLFKRHCLSTGYSIYGMVIMLTSLLLKLYLFIQQSVILSTSLHYTRNYFVFTPYIWIFIVLVITKNLYLHRGSLQRIKYTNRATKQVGYKILNLFIQRINMCMSDVSFKFANKRFCCLTRKKIK